MSSLALERYSAEARDELCAFALLRERLDGGLLLGRCEQRLEADLFELLDQRRGLLAAALGQRPLDHIQGVARCRLLWRGGLDSRAVLCRQKVAAAHSSRAARQGAVGRGEQLRRLAKGSALCLAPSSRRQLHCHGLCVGCQPRKLRVGMRDRRLGLCDRRLCLLELCLCCRLRGKGAPRRASSHRPALRLVFVHVFLVKTSRVTSSRREVVHVVSLIEPLMEPSEL